MPLDMPVSAIAQVIQLAVAPVFLLTGVGAMLGVMATRLARIIDRARAVEAMIAQGGKSERAQREYRRLVHRARLVNWAITLCTTCAFLVCTIIVVLFVEAFLGLNLPALIAALFVAAMLTLIVGLLCFLIEVRISTVTLRIEPH